MDIRIDDRIRMDIVYSYAVYTHQKAYIEVFLFKVIVYT